MTASDILEETYTAISVNKVRSGLTMLGIVIGISSVIAMISIGQGAQASIEASIQSIGSNLIIVTPGAARGPGVTVSAGRGSARSLKLSDADAIKSEVAGIFNIAPEVSGRYQITARGKNTNTQVIGTVSDYPSVRNIEVSSGSFITEQNIRSGSKVAVLGPTASEDLFGVDRLGVGQTIRINKIEFKVIGVTKAKGGSGFSNADDTIYIPLSTAQRFLSGSEYVTSISVAALDANSTSAVQQEITALLLARHNIGDPAEADFGTINQTDIVAAASGVTNTFTILLAAVAGISLVVGGIGIMNMMLTTVTERTREIGLRKAIGARARDINLQFLVEAIMLTSIGGFLGIILGWSVSFGVSYFGILQTKVSVSSVLLAFGVSAIIGIVFGYYPAQKASKMSPIEALRYE